MQWLPQFVSLSAKRCSFVAKFGYCHKMFSVCRLSFVTLVYCDNLQNLEWHDFHRKVVCQLLAAQVLRRNSKEFFRLGPQTRVVFDFLGVKTPANGSGQSLYNSE